MRRYRRRILGWGLLGAGVLCAVGAPMFARSVERDLEERVPAELAERGFTGVSAAFSGQDGVLTCDRPLAAPEDAIDAAIDVWGVRAIELDRSCRVSSGAADGGDTGDAAIDAGSTDGTVSATVPATDASTAISAATTVASTAPAGSEPLDFASVADVVRSGPRFSILAALVAEADATATLEGARPLTLFAPSDTAFEALSVDLLAEVRLDPKRLATLLRHHVAEGALGSAALEPGELHMLDGSAVSVAVDGDTITVDGATVTEPDIVAGNGVVHVVDAVLLVDSELTEPATRVGIVSVTLTDGRLEFGGTVGTDEQRAVLVEAAASAVDPANVDDRLTVTPGAAVDDAAVGDLASLVAAMPPYLVSGEAGYDGSVVYASAVFVDAAARTAFEAAADAVSADVQLEPRPVATPADASGLEAELDALVDDDPILFAPGSATIVAEAAAVLDRLAGVAERFAGVTVTIEGHTDSSGDASDNQVLSERRAAAVVDALVARGAPAGDLVAEGHGESQPVLVDGVEDQQASRRVEIRVAVAT